MAVYPSMDLSWSLWSLQACGYDNTMEFNVRVFVKFQPVPTQRESAVPALLQQRAHIPSEKGGRGREREGREVNCAVKHQTVITYGEPGEICKHLVCGECLRPVLFYSHYAKTKQCVLRVQGLAVLGRRGRNNKPQKNSSWLFALQVDAQTW